MGVAAGEIVAPQIAKSQALGGMIQGISYALCEERRLDLNTGQPLSTDLNDYHLLGLGDISNLHVHFDQIPFETASRGTGLSEMCTVPSAAALGNAVYDALSVRIKSLPLRLDRILGELS